jgi:hypothetical protein
VLTGICAYVFPIRKFTKFLILELSLPLLHDELLTQTASEIWRHGTVLPDGTGGRAE